MKQHATRRRGVLLTSSGRQRLQAAITVSEMAHNNGDRFTLEQLSDRIQVSTKTLSRLWSSNVTVDRRTLKMCFSAFALELRGEDYIISSGFDGAKTSETSSTRSDKKATSSSQSIVGSYLQEKSVTPECICSYPDGPVSPDSALYIERPPLEKLAYQEITQPICVIRIRAARKMGKTSLVLRLLAFAQQQGYYTVKLDFLQIDPLRLNDLNHFFHYFCWRVAKELGIEPNLDENWDEEIGSKLSCFFYLKNYLLPRIKIPLVLVLEQVDRLFEYPQILQEFFPLLRSCYEEARHDKNWQKLKLVVVYSTQAYVPLDINHSPFNIGLPLRLNEFTTGQVEELAGRYGLDWNSGKEANQLMSLIGGHPALVQITLYHIRCLGITLEELILEALANGGIYRYHLWRHWMNLQENPGLIEAYTKVVTAKQGISLNPIEVYKLDSLGVITYEGDRVKPRCELYRAYFEKQLSLINNAD